ncbi:hypothetical protein [Parasitella parasitica]|uniref:Uncharacterized protein n=1 Tax=Parasitella parasitica TaxID=35722 RepID=A0A0B7NAI5_9FUNG|nr:hypothetical protein [Parasitella parasitica]
MSQGRYYLAVTIQRGADGARHQLVGASDDTEEMVAIKKRIALLEAQLIRNLRTGNVRKESTSRTTRQEKKESQDTTQADKLVGVFTSAALDWLIGLDPEVKSLWDAVKSSFLRQHAQGEDPVLAAFNELKSYYKQGNKKMKVFDYLKDRFKSNLANAAAIMSKVTSLADGIKKVATDIERSLINDHRTAYMGPIKQEVIKEEVNYQDNRKNGRHNSYGSKSRGFGYRGSGPGGRGSGPGGRGFNDKHKEECK